VENRASGEVPAPFGAVATAFRFRKGKPADLPHCVSLLPAGFRATDQVRERLLHLWQTLIASEASTFAIVENLECPWPARIDAFGMSIFVTEEFMSKFTAAPRPQLSALVYERMIAGEQVLMTAKELAKANASSGINVLSLHFGMRNGDLVSPRSAQAVSVGAAAFNFFHAGYRTKFIASEVFGMHSARFLEAGGFRLIKDFQRESPLAFADVAPHCYPYLFTLRREWIEPSGVNLLSQLFLAPAATIGFSRAEQRVLEHALLNLSDAEVADALGVSEGAIKKTWRNIFARVDRQAAYLLPDTGAWSGSRGQEKRRHLLEYLRLHLEELRPITRPTANGNVRRRN